MKDLTGVKVSFIFIVVKKSQRYMIKILTVLCFPSPFVAYGKYNGNKQNTGCYNTYRSGKKIEYQKDRFSSK